MTNEADRILRNIAQSIEDAKIERMMRELQSDLRQLVEEGELTEQEANEWANHKADQWSQGLS
jgi:hypothetical protein